MNTSRPGFSFFKKISPLFLLCGFVLLAYLPLSSFLYAVKNDAFVYNYPNKHFFSEALHNGYIPYWNPYLNYGFPLFADPGFAWWNPITWIFGIIGYTPYTFTIEILTYLIIAAVGMYRLGRQFSINKLSAFAMAAMFAGSGFFVGNMQHINFLTCAAFLPWVVAYWWKLQLAPTFKTLLAAAFFTYLLFTAGHPAIPIGTVYFIFILATGYFFLYRKTLETKRFFLYNGLYVFLTVVICLPVILSYAQLMPYYTRSSVVDQAATANLGFSIPSYLSFLSPVATIKGDFFQTDVSMRNGYFSLFGLIALLCILKGKKDKTQKIFLSAAFAMLLLSLGGLVKETLYERLPLLAFIRTNGEFRVFALFSFVVCTGLLLHQSFAEDKPLYSLKRVAAFVAVIAITGAFIGLALLTTNAHSSTPSAEGSFSEQIKAALAGINFPQALLAGSVIAFFLSVVYWFLLKKARGRVLHYFILADVILNAWLLLPVTGVGQKSVGYIATIINQAPKGFPPPSLNTTMPAKPVTPEDEKRIGDWNWFNKQLIYNQIEYPSILRAAQEFYTNASNPLHKKPFAFLANGKGTLTVIKFGPSQIEFNATLNEPDIIVLKQNLYPGWNVQVDNLPMTLTDSDTFLSAALPKGNHKVSFHFSPKW